MVGRKAGEEATGARKRLWDAERKILLQGLTNSAIADTHNKGKSGVKEQPKDPTGG